ncbi:hypothetical protein [Novosphingobium guangzhouense]|uniref:Uncharacterized protein n=1 Tax=Novosphingobium guangzhouense TaxID=1850347 RepID=A0A2K2G5I2_9SPHN|nr:hypothetical protein [Novosphingobium guangzhouense]PNU06289.1 hypothetical protein A8V01_01660 [Novosphingobium guangzhouense]
MPTRRIWRLSRSLSLLVSPLALAAPVLADPAPFELAGPDLRIEVTREGTTLPISRVPSLAPGDKVVIHGALPENQSANFVLMSAFLRGATNPPPKDWIDLARTWKEKEKDKSLTLTVPRDARQMVLLMVPETGGAEGVLVDAVRGKPGEFVRASQDLNQASLDHSRLNAFMAAIRAQDDNGPEYLRTVAPVLARSLSIKLQEDCLSKVIQSQASCLVQNRQSLVLNDVHTSSLAETITGTPTDLALQLSNTREGGAGYYSAYIAVARDVAKIFGAFNNPQFTYLPTLTVRQADTMSLLLNAAPSFQKPKSVMIAAMPAVEADIPPQLRSTAKGPICLVSGAVLPVEGAPLVFSTDFAHDVKVRLTSASGQTLELPVKARADKGGYVLAAETLPAAFAGDVRGHLHGSWGFAPFEGPDFLLQRPGAQPWKAAADGEGLIVGRDNEVTLQGAAPGCVENVTLRQGNGAVRPITWKAMEGQRLAVTVPLADAAAGDMRIEIRQRGAAEVQTVTLRARVQASRLDGLDVHAGDGQGILTGQRLDQVRSVTLGGVEFRPGELTRESGADRLRLVAQGDAKVSSGASDAASSDKAIVHLEDGRNLTLPVRIGGPRPQATLLQRTVYPAPAGQGSKALDVGTGDMLPGNGEMVFSLKAAGKTRFGAGSFIEIAPVEGEAIARLEIGKGLNLESPEVMVATLKPGDLPPATFGAIRFRVVSRGAGGQEERGDWTPLTSLVRLPRVDHVGCEGQDGPCTLVGRDLFLIDAVAVDDGFARPAMVQPGYTGRTLQISGRPADGVVRIRLRDAPDKVVRVPIDK